MQNKLAHISWCFMLSLFLVGLIMSSAYSQKVTVSPEILLRDDYSFALLGEVDKKVLLVRNKGYQQTLSIYNEGLGFVQEIPLDFEDKRVNIIGFVTGKTDFNVYYSYRSGSKEIIKAVKLSAMGQEYYQDTVFMRENVFLTEYYRFDGSDNDRYVCLHNVLDETTIQLILFDNQEMELIYEKKLVVNGVSMRKDLINMSISNDGELALLFDKNNSQFRKEDHYMRVVSITKKGETKDAKIEFNDMLSVDQRIIADNANGGFRIVGLYSDKNEILSQGYFVSDLDRLVKSAFPPEMLSNTSGSSKKKLIGLEDYGLNDIIFRKDGGCLLVLESKKEFHRASSATRGSRAGSYRMGVTDYYNEDILVMSINADGTFLWNTVLPKKQFSQDDDGAYSSFFIFKTPSKLHFVYNDEIKSNNTVSEYVLNPAGVYERNAVLSTAYQKLKLRLRSSIQVSSNAFLLTSERNSRLNIVKIEY